MTDTVGANAANTGYPARHEHAVELHTRAAAMTFARPGEWRRIVKSGSSIFVAAATIGASVSARADSTDQDKALATTLFDQGRALLAGGHVSEACRKLEESERLDPLPGTILNLADCHEREGLTASAVTEFREARALAERAHRDDRIALANQHLQALEPRLSVLVIVVGSEADRPDLIVTRDATPIARAAWGTRIPVDPGEHVIEASAPHTKPSKTVVRVMPDGNVQTVAVTRLEEDVPVSGVATAPPTATPVKSGLATAEISTPRRAGLSTRRAFALVSAGVGVVGLGAGSYFGIRAIQKHDDPQATCTAYPCSSDSLYNQAKFAATASTVSFVAGAVGLGVGAFLWFGDARVSPGTPTVSVLPAVGPGQGGVSLSGRF